MNGNRYNQSLSNSTGGPPVDLTRNATALKDFFENPFIDTSEIHEPVPEDEDPDFVTYNGTLERRRMSLQHVEHLERRGVGEFFQGVWNGITGFVDVGLSSRHYRCNC